MTRDKTSSRSRAAVYTEPAMLPDRESLYRAIEQAASIGYYEWNYAKDRLESCSEGYAAVFDMTVDEVMRAHDSWDKVVAQIHPEDRAIFCQSVDDMHAHQHFDMEYRVVLDNGETRHLREVCVSVVDDSQTISSNFGIVQDVTDRVQHAVELEQRDDLARQAEYLTDIGHYIFDEENEAYLYMSEGFARIHGDNVADLMEKLQGFDSDIEGIVDADRQRVIDAYERYLETGEDLEIEYRLMRPDGDERWIRELNQAKRMKDGRVSHTLGVLQDVTRQKRIEQELLYKDALADQAEALTDIGHYVYDEIADKYLFASPGLARIHGVDTAYLVDRSKSPDTDMEFVHEDDREMLRAFYRDNTAPGRQWVVEFRMTRPDGEVRWIRELGKSYVVNDGIEEQTIGVLMDITAQKLAEQAIVEAKENLEREVAERTRDLADTVAQLEAEIRERKKMSAELQFLANHDALTGLPSLRLGRDRVQQAVGLARRNRQLCAVMFLDLDGFKQINDRLGHDAGDQVLKVTADRIRAEVRETDTVARIGGDEFMVVLSCLPDVAIAEHIAASLIRHVSLEIGYRNQLITVGVSIGIALYPDHGADVEKLIREADKAMYAVKSRGKNQYAIAGFNSGRKLVGNPGTAS